MKIKIDFVTNSSSIAFVVLVPNNFKITKGNAKAAWDDENCFADFDDNIFADIEESIETLKEGNYLWNYGDEGTSPTIYYTTLSLCMKNKFVISSSEIGGEGNNTIFGVKQEIIETILASHINVDEIVTTLNKGVELCCEVEKDSP